jgi:hypothetical protein
MIQDVLDAKSETPGSITFHDVSTGRSSEIVASEAGRPRPHQAWRYHSRGAGALWTTLREVVMATVIALSQAELLTRLSSIARAHGGAASAPDGHTVKGTLVAIKAKWFLGGRRIVSSFTCSLDPATHRAHFRESTVETSWGMPPPTFTVETTSQRGDRVKQTRVDRGVGGGGRLEFGAFRDSVEQAVQDAGWEFVYEVA